jgi:hypothetical protein
MTLVAPPEQKVAETGYQTGRKPKTSGIGPFGHLATMIAGGGCLISMVLIIISLPVGLAALLMTAALLALLGIKDKHGRSALQRKGAKWGYKRQAATGNTRFRGGPLTNLGTHRLPGIAAHGVMDELLGEDGEPMAVIRYDITGHHVTPFITTPDGASLTDHTDSRSQVERYGEWLAGLSSEGGLVQAAFTVETVSDQGHEMARELDSTTADDAPAVAKLAVDQMIKAYPAKARTVKTYGALTWAPSGTGKREEKAARLNEHLLTRLPPLLDSLSQAGAGEVSTMSAQEAAEIVQCAYNPEKRVMYAELEGTDTPAPVLLWNSVGPSATEAHWDFYRHGADGVTVTWYMSGFTSSQVKAHHLSPLLIGAEEIDSSRLTILYRPMDPGRASLTVETDFRAADSRVMNANKPSARAQKDRDDAHRIRSAEADGAGLVDYAVIYSATVRSEKALASARAVVNQLSPSARLFMYEASGSQDSAFAFGLAGVLGLVPTFHTAISPNMRNGL